MSIFRPEPWEIKHITSRPKPREYNELRVDDFKNYD